MLKINLTLHRGVRVAMWLVLAVMWQLCALADSYQAVEIKSCELKGCETLSGKQLLVAGTNATLEIALGGYVEKLTACDFAGTPGRQQHTLTCVILMAEPKNETARGHYYMFGKENPESQYGIPAAESIKEFYPDYTLVDYTDVNPAEKVVGQNLKLEFPLEKGDGMHGNFLWHLFVIYDNFVEYDLGEYGWYPVGPISTLAIAAAGVSIEFEKPVFFDKYGHDFHEMGPNWFVYWREDGACPSAKRKYKYSLFGHVKKEDKWLVYDAAHDDPVKSVANRESHYGMCEDGIVTLFQDASDQHYRTTCTVIDGVGVKHEFGGPSIYGIYCVEETIAHEKHHKKLQDDWPWEGVASIWDSDYKYVLVNGKSREYCDHLTDNAEKSYPYGFDINNTDSFNVAQSKAEREYEAYGDEEFLCMIEGSKAGSKAVETKDWAFPGHQSWLPPNNEKNRPVKAQKKAMLALAANDDNPIQGTQDVDVASVSLSKGTQDSEGRMDSLDSLISLDSKGALSGRMIALITDTNDIVVAYSQKSIQVSPGNSIVKLSFDGEQIYRSRVKGPYRLRSVTLQCDGPVEPTEVGTWDAFDAMIDCTYDDFVRKDAYILNDNISESVSTNGIGIGFDVEINKPGTYQILAEFVTTNETKVARVNLKRDFETGIRRVDLELNPKTVVDLGLDGPYVVRTVCLKKGNAYVDGKYWFYTTQKAYIASWFDFGNPANPFDPRSGVNPFPDYVPPEGEEDNEGEEPENHLGFSVDKMTVGEGETLEIAVNGGSSDRATNAKLYLSYQTASAADLDLAHATVDGKSVKSLKFPYALTWAKGEIGVKTVTIPVKTDKAIEGSEWMTFQLAGDFGADDVTDLCTVTIDDRSRAANTTLAQAVWAPNLKVTTSGDAKWTVADDQESEKNRTGVFGVVSPELGMGRYSRLSVSGFKGYGSLQVHYRIEGVPEESRMSTISYALDGKPVGSDAFELLDDSEANEKIAIVSCDTAKSHTVNIDFRQGFEPTCRMRILRVLWFPAGAGTLYGVRLILGRDGAGFTTGSGYYRSGEKIKAGLQVCPGWTFVSWYSMETDDDGETEYIPLTLGKSFTISVGGSADIVAGFDKIPYVRGLADPADGGKVTGSGYCAEGKKVTLKATANKGHVFMGWRRDDGTLVAKTASIVIDRSTKPTKDSSSSTTITGITGDVTYYAVYVTAEEDRASITASVDGLALEPWVSKTETQALATNVWAGVYLEWPVAASALSLPTVKVSGLPSGLKFTTKPVTTKVTSGSGKSKVTTVVTNVAANTIYGAPTAASKTKKAKDGTVTVTPSAVKVTVTTAGKNKQTYQIDMTVDPLPAWVTGTFAGPSYEEGLDGEGAVVTQTNGVATVSVAVSGKITAKQPVNGKATSFAAKYFDCYDAEGDSFWATLTAKVGKEIVTNVMAVTPAESGMGFIAADRFDAWQYNWKVEPWKTIGKSFDKREMSYEEDGVRVTLKFSANGTAKVAGEFATYDADGNVVMKSGKPVVVKASGSATLLPTVGEDGEMRYLVFVYLAPKGLPPHARCMEIPSMQYVLMRL